MWVIQYLDILSEHYLKSRRLFDIWKCLFSEDVIYMDYRLSWMLYNILILYEIINIIFGHRKDLQYFILSSCSPSSLWNISSLSIKFPDSSQSVPPWRWGWSPARPLFSSSCRCWQWPGREGRRGRLQPGRGWGWKVRMRCWSDQRWSHVEGESAGAGAGTGTGELEAGDGSHRILWWAKLLCWCWKYSQVQIMTFLGFKVSCQISFLKRFIFADWVTPSHWDTEDFTFQPAIERKGATCGGILTWSVDWEAGRATLLLLNIILDNDNLNRNLPQLQWYFMRNQQRHSATVGEGINIKLGHNTTSNRGGATSQHFLVAQRSGQWCWWFWLVNVSLCLEGLGTGEIGKFCLKLNFYQV